MIQPPPIPRDQRAIDASHLKLLSLFHFIAAGLTVFGLLLLLGHYLLFRAFFFEPQTWQSPMQNPPPKEFLGMLMWFYLAAGVWLVGAGVLKLLSGVYLRARKHRVFSLVVASVNCLYVPLGVVLGVFTIIVLVRDSVREAYDG